MDTQKGKYRTIFSAFVLAVVLFLVMLFFLFACNRVSNSTNTKAIPENEIEIRQAWHVFLKALEEGQPEKLARLSLPYLLCTECLNRSENYQEDKYVEASLFYTQQINKEFPSEFVDHIKEIEPKFSTIASEEFIAIQSMFKEELTSTDEVWIVNLLTTPPRKFGLGRETGSHLFPFLKTKEGYKFGGITSVP